jgi:hypothetical protein
MNPSDALKVVATAFLKFHDRAGRPTTLSA